MKKTTLTLLSLLAVFVSVGQNSPTKDSQIVSANGKIVADVRIENKKLVYSVDFAGKKIMTDMPLSITFSNGVVAGEAIKSAKQSVATKKDIITPTVRVKSETFTAHFVEKTFDMGNYQVIFRVYDDAVAYRFVTKFKEKDVRVVSENVVYNFANDDKILFPEESSFYTHQERLYDNTKLGAIADGRFCSPPMLVSDNAVRVLVTEVDLESYPGIYYKKSGSKSFTGVFPHYPLEVEKRSDRDLVVTKHADYLAQTVGTRAYPWRVAMITNQDTKLLESTTLYALASPSRIKDTSWIRPGKVAWDWWNGCNLTGVDFEAGVNMESYKYFIDFASANGLPYIVLDEGWYDINKTILDVVPQMNIPELVAYGKENNVDVILWVTWLGLEESMDKALAQFSKWGVVGLKIDFMQRDDQKMVDWYYSTAKRAAELNMLVDYHGSYKPTGLNRTYPNMLTSEGVLGGECNKWSTGQTPEHNVTLPFIRMAAGPMDYTPGAMTNANVKDFLPRHIRPMSQGTRCHQLGMYVVYESPLQMLCDSPTEYEKETEMMEFLRNVPTVWDETVALKAVVGDYVVMARRSGNTWYLGAMNDWTPRSVEVSLDFLGEGKYTLQSWADGANVDRNAQDYKMSRSEVKKGQKLTLNLGSGGGYAAMLMGYDLGIQIHSK